MVLLLKEWTFWWVSVKRKQKRCSFLSVEDIYLQVGMLNSPENDSYYIWV